MVAFVEGCDIGMFKAGDQLCFSFKTADEIGMVGEAWDDDFDGNFAPDSRLKCAVDCAETARARAEQLGLSIRVSAASAPTGKSP